MLEMKIKIEADAAVLKAIDKLTTALEKNAVNISVPQDCLLYTSDAADEL